MSLAARLWNARANLRRRPANTARVCRRVQTFFSFADAVCIHQHGAPQIPTELRETPERAMVKVGINGFGRIGRLTFRYAFDMPEVEVVHVNELLGGAETAAYLAKYDSVHGTWPHKVDHADDHFTVDGQKISFTDKEDFTQVGLQHTHRRG